MGFREGYAEAKPTILEPIMKVEVQAPEEFQGAVMGQLNQRRGTIIDHRERRRATFTATAEVPLNDDVRLLDRPALGDAGQGRVHDGVREVRRRCPSPSRKS